MNTRINITLHPYGIGAGIRFPIVYLPVIYMKTVFSFLTGVSLHSDISPKKNVFVYVFNYTECLLHTTRVPPTNLETDGTLFSLRRSLILSLAAFSLFNSSEKIIPMSLSGGMIIQNGKIWEHKLRKYEGFSFSSTEAFYRVVGRS